MIGQYLLNPAQTNYSINELGKEHLNIYGIDEEGIMKEKEKEKELQRFNPLKIEQNILLWYWI